MSPKIEELLYPKSSDGQKSPKTIHRSDADHSQIIVGDADADQSQIIVGDADADHSKIIGGIYPPIPPFFRHPCLYASEFALKCMYI